ncbi:unnamed protein product [Staurois parvus]|uniref:Uncharacterized protein n=1 Tax=Staurois parvus TaxID=386267 RepID=A0ABN9DZC9_9NEOB|nr:unnamed protein product [Staurois parvus]
MDEDRRNRAERVLHLTLEILYLLTGEDYVVVKKTFINELSRKQSPTMEPLLPSLTPERNIDKKILKVTQKIVDLLTGEVSGGAGNSGTFSNNRQGMCLDGDCIIVCVRFL